MHKFKISTAIMKKAATVFHANNARILTELNRDISQTPLKDFTAFTEHFLTSDSFDWALDQHHKIRIYVNFVVTELDNAKEANRSVVIRINYHSFNASINEVLPKTQTATQKFDIKGRGLLLVSRKNESNKPRLFKESDHKPTIHSIAKHMAYMAKFDTNKAQQTKQGLEALDAKFDTYLKSKRLPTEIYDSIINEFDSIVDVNGILYTKLYCITSAIMADTMNDAPSCNLFASYPLEEGQTEYVKRSGQGRRAGHFYKPAHNNGCTTVLMTEGLTDIAYLSNATHKAGIDHIAIGINGVESLKGIVKVLENKNNSGINKALLAFDNDGKTQVGLKRIMTFATALIGLGIAVQIINVRKLGGAYADTDTYDISDIATKIGVSSFNEAVKQEIHSGSFINSEAAFNVIYRDLLNPGVVNKLSVSLERSIKAFLKKSTDKPLLLVNNPDFIEIGSSSISSLSDKLQLVCDYIGVPYAELAPIANSMPLMFNYVSVNNEGKPSVTLPDSIVDQRHIVIKAPQGSGKTSIIKSMLDKWKQTNTSTAVVTPTQILAKQQAEAITDAVFYQNHSGFRKESVVVTTIDSLYKMDVENIIMDEAPLVLQALVTNGRVRQRLPVANKIKAAIETGRTLLASADIDSSTIKAMACLSDMPYTPTVLVSTYKKKDNKNALVPTTITYEKACYVTETNNAIDKATATNPVMIVSDSLTMLKGMTTYALKQGKKTLLISSLTKIQSTPLEYQLEGVEVLALSPAASSGVSLVTEKYKVFGWYADVVTASEFLQMLNRARKRESVMIGVKTAVTNKVAANRRRNKTELFTIANNFFKSDEGLISSLVSAMLILTFKDTISIEQGLYLAGYELTVKMIDAESVGIEENNAKELRKYKTKITSALSESTQEFDYSYIDQIKDTLRDADRLESIKPDKLNDIERISMELKAADLVSVEGLSLLNKGLLGDNGLLAGLGSSDSELASAIMTELQGRNNDGLNLIKVDYETIRKIIGLLQTSGDTKGFRQALGELIKDNWDSFRMKVLLPLGVKDNLSKKFVKADYLGVVAGHLIRLLGFETKHKSLTVCPGLDKAIAYAAREITVTPKISQDDIGWDTSHMSDHGVIWLSEEQIKAKEAPTLDESEIAKIFNGDLEMRNYRKQRVSNYTYSAPENTGIEYEYAELSMNEVPAGPESMFDAYAELYADIVEEEHIDKATFLAG